jgi:hypothetical protein
MAFPSRVQGSGTSGGQTQAICGDVSASVTATGSVAGDAASVSAVVTRVATAAAGTGVKLPPAEVGAMMFVRNDGANALTVYPQTGGTINGAASDSIAAGKAHLFFGTSATAWVSLDGA